MRLCALHAARVFTANFAPESRMAGLMPPWLWSSTVLRPALAVAFAFAFDSGVGQLAGQFGLVGQTYWAIESHGPQSFSPKKCVFIATDCIAP